LKSHFGQVGKQRRDSYWKKRGEQEDFGGRFWKAMRGRRGFRGIPTRRLVSSVSWGLRIKEATIRGRGESSRENPLP